MGAAASIQNATFEGAKAESERLRIRLPHPLKKAHDKVHIKDGMMMMHLTISL